METEQKQNKELDKKPSEQVLLTEYQACQNESHYYGTTCWTIIGIFLSFVTAVAAFIIKNILETNNDLLNSNSNERWVILGLSLLAIAIILSLALWLKRTNRFMRKADERAKEIASQLKMQLNDKMDEIIEEKGPHLKGHCIASILFTLASIPWIFLAIISASKWAKDIILR